MVCWKVISVMEKYSREGSSRVLGRGGKLYFRIGQQSKLHQEEVRGLLRQVFGIRTIQGEILEASHLSSRSRQRKTLRLRVLTRLCNAVKINMQLGKENRKLSFFTDNIIFYLESTKNQILIIGINKKVQQACQM